MLDSGLSWRVFLAMTISSYLVSACVSTSLSSSGTPSSVKSADKQQDRDEGYDFGISDWSPARRDVNASHYFMIGEYAALENNPQIAEKYY